MTPRIPSITKKKQRKRRFLLVTLAVLLVIAVLSALALTVFRPQAVALYRELRNFLFVRPDSAYRQYEDPNGRTVIWLDAGHGGSDPGAVSPFLEDETEATVNARLTQLVKAALERYGYTVRLTHEDGTPTEENGQYSIPFRYGQVNADPEADLFVWIHSNSYTDPTVSGGRIYYVPDRSPYNHYYAEAVADGIEEAHDGERPTLYPMKVTQTYEMLREIAVPAFLIETLFVSNASDAAKLLDPAWLQREAEGIALGIHHFVAG